MKEALVHRDTSVTIHTTEIPAPGPSQLLIRVVACGLNPKDWKVPSQMYEDGAPPTNEGDDVAGYVEIVGKDVFGFRVGDRVAAFHQVMAPFGGYAEFAVVEDFATFHVAQETSFEEAATVPLAGMTAALGLYQRLRLPLPWNPTTEPLALIIYGGATAVGAFTIKLARLSNIHPLIVIAGKGIPYVETLIDRSKGDTMIDYRTDPSTLSTRIREAAKGKPIHYAYDAVGEHGSHAHIGGAMSAPGQITTMDLNTDYVLPEGITMPWTIAGSVHFPPKEGMPIGDGEFAKAMLQFMGRGLAKGWFSGHPVEVQPGGLDGIEGGLRDLKAGRASALKYVVRFGETEGVGRAEVLS
ncbi:chaperonin 10-like protein [Aspergillus carlsbadensis]|nr:chaperonin 10-like protein [Aspergillus carlsbadensis]